MKKILLPLVFLISFYSHTAWAQICAPKAPSVEVNLHTEPLKLIENKSMTEISGVKKQDIPALGLFSALTQNKITAQTEMEEAAGGVCMRVTDFRYDVSYQPIMYIASEAHDYACTLNRTREHEARHYKHATDAVEAGIPVFKRLAEKRLNRYFFGRSAEDAKSKIVALNQELDAMWLKIIDTSEFDLAMDTPENYKREASECPESENRELFKRAGAVYE